ncbi:MAG: hypothetical protein LBG42_07605 [Treponema sp.]|jgi:hypothetical protein|nr:hypothetical protein [Treponema sp.]
MEDVRRRPWAAGTFSGESICRLNNYPWIQKLEVEPDAFFCHTDLLQLVPDQEDFERLPDEDKTPCARADGIPGPLAWHVY